MWCTVIAGMSSYLKMKLVDLLVDLWCLNSSYRLWTSQVWTKWQPSATDNAVFQNYHNNMSLLRLCAYSVALTRSFAADRSVQRFLNSDYCHLCLRIRSNGERQIQGNIMKQFYCHAVICLVLQITLRLSFVLYQVYFKCTLTCSLQKKSSIDCCLHRWSI